MRAVNVTDFRSRAEEAGYRAICLTVDTPRLGRRETDVRDELEIPPEAMPANFEGLVDVPEGPGSGPEVAAQAEELLDPSENRDDLDWLVGLAEPPVVVKGILLPDDARRAVEHGVEAVVVSHHGGRRVLEMLRNELESACALLGCPSAEEITRERVEWRTRTP